MAIIRTFWPGDLLIVGSGPTTLQITGTGVNVPDERVAEVRAAAARSGVALIDGSGGGTSTLTLDQRVTALEAGGGGGGGGITPDQTGAAVGKVVAVASVNGQGAVTGWNLITPAGGSGGGIDAEAAQDAAAALLVAGVHTNITATYNDAANRLDLAISGTLPDGVIPSGITRDSELSAAITAAIDALKAGAPTALDTLDELAAALGDDGNFAATVTTALGARLRVDAAQSLTSGQQAQARTNLGLAAVAATGAYTDLTGRPTIPAAYTDEQAQDASAALFSAGTHTGITFAYDDAGNRISATVTGGGGSSALASATDFDESGASVNDALIVSQVTSGAASAFDLTELPPDRIWAPQDPHPRPGVNRTPITLFQSGHGWTQTGGAGTTDLNRSTDAAVGSQYARLVTQGLGTGTPARLTGTGMSVDLTNKTLWLLMRVTGSDQLDNVQVYAGNSGFAAYYMFQLDRYTDVRAKAWFREGEWCWMPFGFEVATTTGTPPRAAISDMRVTIIDHGGPVTADIAGLATTPNDQSWAWPQGVVSFTFDDGWVSQYTTARPALDKYLYPATAYVIADAIDGTANLGGEGSMNLTQLQSLRDANRWEVAAHAASLANHDATFTALTDAQLDAEFAAMKSWLRKNEFGGGDHIAYPQGVYDPRVLTRIRRFFTSARTVHDFSRETYPYGDRHRLRVVNLNNGISLATAKARVDAAKATGGWLIIVTHRLAATATDGTTWATADFQALVDYVNAANMPVRTVGSVLSHRGEEAARLSGGGRVVASTNPTVSPGVVNTVTETPVASFTVPATRLLAGDLLTLDLGWDVLNNSGANLTFTYRFKVNGTTIGQTGAISLGTSSQRVNMTGRFHIALPQLNAPRVWGSFWGAFASGGFGGINSANAGVLAPATPNVDFGAADVPVEFTCQMGTAAATADFRLTSANLTRDRG